MEPASDVPLATWKDHFCSLVVAEQTATVFIQAPWWQRLQSDIRLKHYCNPILGSISLLAD